MPTEASFRFSTYLTLALACVVLGYSEYELLPEVGLFGALAVAALGGLYFLESRVAFLSIPAANRLGMVVGLFYLMWAAYRVKREVDTIEFANTGWHMFVVAMCGPFVMLLIVAKVARGDKHAGDYWTLHGIALAGVGLAAALAEQPACFALVGLYLAAAVWSLTLLNLGRAHGAIPPVPGGRQPATKAVAVSADPTGHRTDVRPALLWAAVAVAAAVPLYLLTPRSEASKADFGKPRIEIGYAADQMVDLNRTGPLGVNPDTAFAFTATHADGTPKTDVNPEQRWRGKSLRAYGGGKWEPADNLPLSVTHASGPWRLGAPVRLARRADEWVPPALGPGQFTFAFEVPGQQRGTVVADPVVWAPDQPPPLAFQAGGGPRGWLPLSDGTFFWDPELPSRGTTLQYTQTYRAQEEPDVSPPFRLTDARSEFALTALRVNPVPRVKEYADRVLNELIRTGELPADCRDDRSLLPKPEHRDAVARKFCAHLATTPDLQYTTDLKRENLKADPIEDFLFNTRSGHCERFAGAGADAPLAGHPGRLRPRVQGVRARRERALPRQAGARARVGRGAGPAARRAGGAGRAAEPSVPVAQPGPDPRLRAGGRRCRPRVVHAGELVGGVAVPRVRHELHAGAATAGARPVRRRAAAGADARRPRNSDRSGIRGAVRAPPSGPARPAAGAGARVRPVVR